MKAVGGRDGLGTRHEDPVTTRFAGIFKNSGSAGYRWGQSCVYPAQHVPMPSAGASFHVFEGRVLGERRGQACRRMGDDYLRRASRKCGPPIRARGLLRAYGNEWPPQASSAQFRASRRSRSRYPRPGSHGLPQPGTVCPVNYPRGSETGYFQELEHVITGYRFIFVAADGAARAQKRLPLPE